MVLAALLFGICQASIMLGALLLSRWWLNRKQADIERRLNEAVREWVEAPAEGQPSRLAITLDAMGAVIGAAAARSLMASMKQSQSSVAQVANGAADELQGKVNPIMALLAGGKRGKGAAVARLSEMLLPLLTGNRSSNGGGAGGGPPSSYSL